MPKISKLKKYKKYQNIEGFEKICDTLQDIQSQIKDAEQQQHYGKRKVESCWQLHKLNNQKSRYVYNLYYKDKSISRDLYNYLLQNQYADKYLIAKWKKNGYEKLCCTLCIQTQNSNFGNVCICRVPKNKTKIKNKKETENLEGKNNNKSIDDGESNTNNVNDNDSYAINNFKEKMIQCNTCGCRGCASTD